jgi:internalin A
LENDRLGSSGVYLKLVQWEIFPDNISPTGLQGEYLRELKTCDIFLSLFFTKAGEFTVKEFETAHSQFTKFNKPVLYTYFKDAPVNIRKITEKDIASKTNFEVRLKDLGHFPTMFTNVDDLKNQFKRQLEIQLSAYNPSNFLVQS